MRRLALSSFVLSACLPGLAQAYTVYPGCAVPTTKAGHHTFYVDPVKGSAKGDGSAAKPWHTLQEVIAANLVATQGHKKVGGTDPLVDVNPNGPVKAGDTIMLMTGNHGDPVITDYFNKDFITVMAAPGQTPAVGTLTVVSSAKWLFQGLKFQKAVGTKVRNGLITLGGGDWLGVTNNIVMDSNSVSTTDDTSSWSDSDWTHKIQGAGIWIQQNTTCMSLTNNHIYNVFSGIGLTSSQSVAQGNLIEKMTNDGIDITNVDQIIKNNTIRSGANNSTNGYHADGIQGWSAKNANNEYIINKNVTIDGNIIIKGGDPNVSYMQGISIFDGKWQNLAIQNNVVVTTHWNAISVYGAQNSTIINNTVIAADPTAHPSWILVRAAKDGTPSSNVIIRNNIATQVIASGNNITADHNIAVKYISIPVGSAVKSITSGQIGTANKIVSTAVNGFATFDTASQQFNMTLRPTSPAIAFGSASDAPATDIVGRRRQSPVDVGAYMH